MLCLSCFSFSFSKWPHKLSPSCHPIPWQYIYHQLIYHNSILTMIPWTITIKLEKFMKFHWNSYLEYGGAIRCSPCIQQIIFSSRHKPFTACGKLQTKYAAFMKMQLILVRLWCMQYFNIWILHTDSKPITFLEIN